MATIDRYCAPGVFESEESATCSAGEGEMIRKRLQDLGYPE